MLDISIIFSSPGLEDFSVLKYKFNAIKVSNFGITNYIMYITYSDIKSFRALKAYNLDIKRQGLYGYLYNILANCFIMEMCRYNCRIILCQITGKTLFLPLSVQSFSLFKFWWNSLASYFYSPRTCLPFEVAIWNPTGWII